MSEASVKTQFKKGQSGNPKGRPKKSRDWPEIGKSVTFFLRHMLEQPCYLFDGDGRQITWLERLLLDARERADQGDWSAAKFVMELADRADRRQVQALRRAFRAKTKAERDFELHIARAIQTMPPALRLDQQHLVANARPPRTYHEKPEKASHRESGHRYKPHEFGYYEHERNVEQQMRERDVERALEKLARDIENDPELAAMRARRSEADVPSAPQQDKDAARYCERPGEPCKHKPNMPDGSYHPYPHRDEIRAEHSKQTSSSHGAAKQPRPGDPYDVEKKDGLPGSRCFARPGNDGSSVGSAVIAEKSGAITGKITGPITGLESASRTHQPIDGSLKSELQNSARIFLPEFLPDRGRLARFHASFDSHAGETPAVRHNAVPDGADCSNFISPPPLGRRDIERLNGAG